MAGRITTVVVALLAAACGGANEPPAAEAPVTTPPATVAQAPKTTEPARIAEAAYEVAPPEPEMFKFEPPPVESPTPVALTESEIEVFESPDAPEPFMTMPAQTILGSTTVLGLVTPPTDGWAQVSLPIRPNGSTGWVRAEDIELYVVNGRIVVDLSEKTLTYYENGEVVLTTAVAIGNESSPTPTGQFYVTDSVTLTRPGSPWGPNALGLSARSDYITEFNGGDGIIGIHGTSNPDSIGNAASLGCVRLPNEMITQLHELAPIGTPVEIRA